MLAKSPAIVIGSVKYGDSSVILKTYSRERGLISFIAGGVRGKKGGLKSSIMLPLNQLEVVFYEHSKGDLKRLKEVSSPHQYQTLFFDPVKNCMCMFLAEVLSHLLHEEEPQPPLFDYLSHSIYLLDEVDEGVANFHLVFLHTLTFYLGFLPEEPSDKKYFDLLNGVYLEKSPIHNHFLEGEELDQWKQLFHISFEDLQKWSIHSISRSKLLKSLLEYYRLHIKDFGELKSLEVLHTILH